MYTELFQELGLSKNEAEIYETLLEQGELPVGRLSTKSKVHRRNVYDVLERLVEKGLVFEIVEQKENRYQAVDPKKLAELIQEKGEMLSKDLPNLQKLYKNTPHEEEVFVYRGAEGWKNYMRDMLQIADTAYFIGAKGAWLDARVKHFYPKFIKEAQKKQIKFYHLFDHEVKTTCPEILPKIGKYYKFLPKEYSTKAAIDIFGNHVNIISGVHLGGLDESFSLTIIVNETIANAFRVWFQFMWQMCPSVKKHGE